MEIRFIAYVARSGKFAPDPTGIVTEDGTVISTNRIYITGLMKGRQGRRDIVGAISHELAHFVSPFGFSVVDTFAAHASIPREEQRFRDDGYNRIQNAENYGWFTWRSFEGKFTW